MKDEHEFEELSASNGQEDGLEENREEDHDEEGETEGQTRLTTLDSLGEFGLIERLLSKFPFPGSDELEKRIGPGDDAALWTLNEGESLLTSVEMFIEGVHFDVSYHPLRHLGYKLVVAGLSDILAMGGKGIGCLVGLSVSSRYTLESLEELYDGIRLACKAFNLKLLGGDTTASPSGMQLSITTIGSVQKENVTKRSGAEENQVVLVTGDLGGAFCGLQLLEREKRIYFEHPQIQPELVGYDYILQRQLRPEARVDILAKLEAAEVLPTAMIDISDGLANETLHLSKASKVGIRLYEEHFPIDPQTESFAKELNIDPTTCVLHGGEDYELLLIVTKEDYEKLKNDPDFTAIGYTTSLDRGAAVISRSGEEHPLVAQGWGSKSQNGDVSN